MVLRSAGWIENRYVRLRLVQVEPVPVPVPVPVPGSRHVAAEGKPFHGSQLTGTGTNHQSA